MATSKYSEKDKDLFGLALQDDITILLEEFEEVTGRQVIKIHIGRVDIDEKKYHKAFEYIAAIDIKES